MALTSQATTTLQVPGENQNVTIRKLSFRQLDAAQQERRRQAIELVASLGDVASKLPQEMVTPDDEGAEPDRSTIYDRFSVLKAGVTAWTYDAPCVADNIADLDQETAKWLFDEILNFSLRSVPEGKESPPSSNVSMTTSAEAVGLSS